MGTVHYWYCIQKWYPYRYWHYHYTLVQYRYRHGTLPVLTFQNGARTSTGILPLWFSTGIGTVHSRYWHWVVPVPVLANMHLDSVPVWAHSITRTGIQLCPYQYWLIALWFSTIMGRFHYWYWQSMMTVPVLAFMHFGPVPVLAWYITGTDIKWCPYRYWHFCTFVQYQYGYGKFPVLALDGARTGIGIYAFWSSTSIGMVHYRYWH